MRRVVLIPGAANEWGRRPWEALEVRGTASTIGKSAWLFFPTLYILVSFPFSYLFSLGLSFRLRFADCIASVTLFHSLRGEDSLTPILLHLRGSQTTAWMLRLECWSSRTLSASHGCRSSVGFPSSLSSVGSCQTLGSVAYHCPKGCLLDSNSSDVKFSFGILFWLT